MLSSKQRETLARCIKARENGTWYRASGNGERVTLASLYCRGLCVRRCHRGREGESNAAHEYRPAEPVMVEWRAKCARAVERSKVGA
jgi:hypothetical protein